ncbi:MAG: hypothetical protein KBB70_01965 [Candidatus Pacebacteria bacterium]|nr:hypothetical protein [Candidatus Paceibacterota bacterium]
MNIYSMKNTSNKKRMTASVIVPLLIFSLIFQYSLVVRTAMAASLTALSDSQSTIKAATVSNHDITFTTPTGVASGQTIILTWDNSTSVNASLDYTDIDVLDDGVNVTLAASPSGATWGAVRTSSTVITLTNGTTPVVAASVVRIKIGTNATNQSTGVRQITNGSAGTSTLAITGTFTDTGTISTPIIADDVVNITATVNQTITFAVSDNTIGFGTLTAGAAHYATGDTAGTTSDTAAHNVTVATNAANGYTITLQGATLTSGLNTIDAIGATSAASSAGTEQFGIYATKSGGVNGTITTRYSDSATPGFAYNATAGASDTLSTGTSSTATETYAIHYLANITATTEAGSYATNITYVGTGNF